MEAYEEGSQMQIQHEKAHSAANSGGRRRSSNSSNDCHSAIQGFQECVEATARARSLKSTKETAVLAELHHKTCCNWLVGCTKSAHTLRVAAQPAP